MENPHRPNGTHKLVHYLPVAIVAATALLGYGALQNRVAVAEEKVEKVEAKQDAQSAATQQTAITVAEAKVELKVVKDQVKAANDKLDRLLERR